MQVIITAKRQTEYASLVEMSRKEYDAYCEQLDEGGAAAKRAEKSLNNLIDVDDWQDDKLENIDIEPA